ncbi:MAG: class I SAM-dependent methyltransferase [Lachnospiraceae bacterium]|nr:class I SAM-dependent methyltransferase [Lachnospiraceae bacterium]
MKKWSRYFQNKEYLEKTRMFILNEDMRGYIVEKIGLRPGMKVLDVGCGTGAFTYYLAEAVRDVTFTGLDFDPDFVDAAQKKIPDRKKNGCGFCFLKGDAKELPFEPESFDIVVSHTFFNSMPQYREALREMIRVCRQGGIIASVTAMDVDRVPYSTGIYPRDADVWKKRYDILLEKVQAMYDNIVPMQDYLGGIPTAYIPNLFEEERLKDVSAYPVGRFFSLSNKAISDEKKQRYIELGFLSDTKRLNCVYEEPEAKAFMSEEEISEFTELLKKRRDYLTDHLKDNRIWEWEGGSNLLVTGLKPEENEILMDAILSLVTP